MPDMTQLLEQTSAIHSHLCPRQVLGVRSGMLAALMFGLSLPQADKRLFAFVETDGCFADGVAVSTGCALGRRTLRLVDYGKVAVTFVDTDSGRVVRVAPRSTARDEAIRYTPDAPDHWHAQLEAYKVMPDEELFSAEPVQLTVSMREIISRPGLRVACARCGEEIMNEREVLRGAEVLCRYCAGSEPYYRRECAADFDTLTTHDAYPGTAG
jgi:formylmethanofuran dehydrogenase subunit E